MLANITQINIQSEHQLITCHYLNKKSAGAKVKLYRSLLQYNIKQLNEIRFLCFKHYSK